MTAAPEATSVLAGVAGRLRTLRTERRLTLIELSKKTGNSKSTLSLLETGQRKPSLELLLPIADAHSVALDELVGALEVGSPRIRPQLRRRGTHTVVPLTQQPSGMHARKMLIPPEHKRPQLESHDGYEWSYVLSGELRPLLGGHDITMKSGEVAEFDTGVPHWFGAAGNQPVEILSILGRPGERAHVRAAPRRNSTR